MENQEHLIEDAEEFKEELPPAPKKSLFIRICGKMDRGSLRGSVFTLLSVVIHPGCLALPLVLKYTGLVLGLVILAITATIAYFALVGISVAVDKYKIYHYPDLVGQILGKKIQLVVSIIFIIYIYLTMIASVVILGEFVMNITAAAGADFGYFDERASVLFAALVLIEIPMGLYREMTDLRFITMICSIAVAFLVLVLIIEFPFFVNENEIAEVPWVKLNSYVVVSFSTCSYILTCHLNLPQIQGELAQSNLRRTKKVCFRTIFSVYLAYSFIALFGYLSVLDNTPKIITNRERPDGIKNDWAMIIAQVLLGMTSIISAPIALPPMRACICKVFFKTGPQPPLVLHVIVTIVSLSSATVVAVVYPKILFLFSILGGIGGGVFIFILPGNLYEAVFWMDANEVKYCSFKGVLLSVSSIIFLSIGVYSTVITF